VGDHVSRRSPMDRARSLTAILPRMANRRALLGALLFGALPACRLADRVDLRPTYSASLDEWLAPPPLQPPAPFPVDDPSTAAPGRGVRGGRPRGRLRREPPRRPGPRGRASALPSQPRRDDRRPAGGSPDADRGRDGPGPAGGRRPHPAPDGPRGPRRVGGAL